MEQEKITDKIDNMTDEPDKSGNDSVMKAIGELASKAETLPAVWINTYVASSLSVYVSEARLINGSASDSRRLPANLDLI